MERMSTSRFGMLYHNEQRLVVGKDVSESILSMACDASFWMAADGDTLLDTSNRLEAIFGSGLNGAALSDHMPPPESTRLHALITESEERLSVAVHLLPTTFCRHRVLRSVRICSSSTGGPHL